MAGRKVFDFLEDEIRSHAFSSASVDRGDGDAEDGDGDEQGGDGEEKVGMGEKLFDKAVKELEHLLFKDEPGKAAGETESNPTRVIQASPVAGPSDVKRRPFSPRFVNDNLDDGFASQPSRRDTKSGSLSRNKSRSGPMDASIPPSRPSEYMTYQPADSQRTESSAAPPSRRREGLYSDNRGEREEAIPFPTPAIQVTRARPSSFPSPTTSAPPSSPPPGSAANRSFLFPGHHQTRDEQENGESSATVSASATMPTTATTDMATISAHSSSSFYSFSNPSFEESLDDDVDRGAGDGESEEDHDSDLERERELQSQTHANTRVREERGVVRDSPREAGGDRIVYTPRGVGAHKEVQTDTRDDEVTPISSNIPSGPVFFPSVNRPISPEVGTSRTVTTGSSSHLTVPRDPAMPEGSIPFSGVPIVQLPSPNRVRRSMTLTSRFEADLPPLPLEQGLESREMERERDVQRASSLPVPHPSNVTRESSSGQVERAHTAGSKFSDRRTWVAGDDERNVSPSFLNPGGGGLGFEYGGDGGVNVNRSSGSVGKRIAFTKAPSPVLVNPTILPVPNPEVDLGGSRPVSILNFPETSQGHVQAQRQTYSGGIGVVNPERGDYRTGGSGEQYGGIPLLSREYYTGGASVPEQGMIVRSSAPVVGAGGGTGPDKRYSGATAAMGSTAESENPKATIGKRLTPTLEDAKKRSKTYERQARTLSFVINVALGMQVLLGALITGIAAAASPKAAKISTVLLGGVSTLVASFLARVRGSGEPELSKERVRDLQKFIRNCEATILDWGNVAPEPLSDNPFPKHVELLKKIDELREEYDMLVHGWDGDNTVGAAKSKR